MSRQAVIAMTALTTLSALAVKAADPVRAFPGASPADVTRAIPSDAFKLRLPPERELIESLSYWIQLDDGGTIITSLLVSNLGKPRQPAVAVSYYPASGTPVQANQEFSASQLETGPTRVSFGRNLAELQPDGQYRLRLAATIRGGGELTGDFTFTPTLPGYRRGDGRVHYGATGKYFEMTVLFPRARVEGRLSIRDRVQTIRGEAYGDHSLQNLWAHHIANRWLNYRFFSPDLFIASTSLETSTRYGRQPVHHVLVADRTKLLFGTDRNALELNSRMSDPESGYAVPREVRSVITGDGTTISLTVPTARHLERTYMLADLNPILRGFLRTFIARPYVYRYRAPVTATVTGRDGAARQVPGTFVGELIFVNE